MEEPLFTAGQNNYIKHLSNDILLKAVLEGQEPRTINKVTNPVFFLYSSVIMQQLSTKVGNVLLKRFLDLFDGREPAATEVLAMPVEKLRAIGISVAKANYIKNIAQFDLDNGLDPEKLNAMTDDEVTAYITSIKGIGKWTAHIFLISALGREDVFPADDLILQKAVELLYGLDRKDKKAFMEKMHAIAAQWSPYRSYASMHLWRWDGVKR
jgi:DNA-3-methyladenine glycosylase II